MITVYQGESSNPRKLSGKEIIAEMSTRTDPVHWAIMDRLRDECSHDYPHVEVWRPGDPAKPQTMVKHMLCCGCNRTRDEQKTRELELRQLPRMADIPKPVWAELEKNKGEWIG